MLFVGEFTPTLNNMDLLQCHKDSESFICFSDIFKRHHSATNSVSVTVSHQKGCLKYQQLVHKTLAFFPQEKNTKPHLLKNIFFICYPPKLVQIHANIKQSTL